MHVTVPTSFEGRAVARQTLRYRYGLPAPHAGGALFEVSLIRLSPLEAS
jgi:hypothetical protein